MALLRYPDEILKGSFGVSQTIIDNLRDTGDTRRRANPASPTLCIHCIHDKDTCLSKCGYSIYDDRIDPSYPFYPVPSKACQASIYLKSPSICCCCC